MKIRTRLLLFLLPTLVGSIAIISTVLSYKWYKEIVDNFKTRLKTVVISTAASTKSEEFNHFEILESRFLSEEFQFLKEEFEISKIYPVALNSPELTSIPKDLHITPIYNSESNRRIMTGYAPIFNQEGHLAGLIAADIHVDLIDKKFNESLFWIVVSSGLTILLLVAMLFWIANRISRPVQRLNNSALAIAAGKYGESIDVKGPIEIAELANTLNTMSECLLENINRLKENSLLREKMYGEYECSMLLQHLMLQKNIENCRSDAFAIQAITLFSDDPRGFLLDVPKKENPSLSIVQIAEAESIGFEGIYELLTRYKQSRECPNQTTLKIDRERSTLSFNGPHIPIVWSLDQRSFIDKNIESGDYFFLFNRGFSHFYKDQENIEKMLSKVLRAFAHEGLDTVSKMIKKEMVFASKRKAIEQDLHLLAFQILNL